MSVSLAGKAACGIATDRAAEIAAARGMARAIRPYDVAEQNRRLTRQLRKRIAIQLQYVAARER